MLARLPDWRLEMKFNANEIGDQDLMNIGTFRTMGARHGQ